jgi:hypothetical protein
MPKRLRLTFDLGSPAFGAFAVWLGLSDLPANMKLQLQLAFAAIAFAWVAIWTGVLANQWRAAATPPPDSPEADYRDPPDGGASGQPDTELRPWSRALTGPRRRG